MSYHSKRRSESLGYHNRTMPLNNRENEEQNAMQSQRGSSVDVSEIKLPVIEIKKVMKKIGAAEKELPLFQPS